MVILFRRVVINVIHHSGFVDAIDDEQVLADVSQVELVHHSQAALSRVHEGGRAGAGVVDVGEVDI